MLVMQTDRSCRYRAGFYMVCSLLIWQQLRWDNANAVIVRINCVNGILFALKFKPVCFKFKHVVQFIITIIKKHIA